MLLAGEKSETLAKFQQETLQLRHQRLLQIAFQQAARIRQAEEFKQHRVGARIHARQRAGCC